MRWISFGSSLLSLATQCWGRRSSSLILLLGLIAAGGNVYYLAKFAGILGLDVQDLGAAQTGMTKEEFKAKKEGKKA